MLEKNLLMLIYQVFLKLIIGKNFLSKNLIGVGFRNSNKEELIHKSEIEDYLNKFIKNITHDY